MKDFLNDYVRQIIEDRDISLIKEDETTEDLSEEKCVECDEEIDKLLEQLSQELELDLIEETDSDDDIELSEEKTSDETLTEVGSSTVKISKARKIDMLTGLTAIKMAQKKNDPLYAKYKKFRDVTMKLKKAIAKKYKSKSKRSAKKALA